MFFHWIVFLHSVFTTKSLFINLSSVASRWEGEADPSERMTLLEEGCFFPSGWVLIRRAAGRPARGLSQQSVILSPDPGKGVSPKPVAACSGAAEYEIARKC